MSYSVPPEIAIHGDGKHLILPVDFNDAEIANVREHEEEILATLRTSQMNSAGFLTAFPTASYQELSASPWVVLDVLTTAVTGFLLPERISANTWIGDETWLSYRASNPGTTLNTSPRLRVLTVYTPALGTCAWVSMR